VVGFFFFDRTVTGAAYLNMLEASTMPIIHPLNGNVEFYFRDGKPPQFHCEVRGFLDEMFPN
jgi:hypothetical protein